MDAVIRVVYDLLVAVALWQISDMLDWMLEVNDE